ncbi:chromate transporter [Acetobacter musti]|uniref:Chromate transporter n=1 Tax=Acetobacter musti TaxID=864732 RepID=A0ABX0JXI3_9PROT|nr:chromate transporter [Acetobacter musti]NHN86705.1 chromate transporter [Acetobacter musti]
MANRLVELMFALTPLSLATVGGGQSSLPGIQRQVVTIHHWMTSQQFVDAYAISRMSPGPSSLLVTLIGWRVAGSAGAVVATLSIFIPTALLVLTLAGVWSRHRGARWQTALETGLRPIAAGLIIAAGYVLIRGMAGGWPTRVITIVTTGILLKSRVTPLLLLGGGMLLCIAFYELGFIPGK